MIEENEEENGIKKDLLERMIWKERSLDKKEVRKVGEKGIEKLMKYKEKERGIVDKLEVEKEIKE